MDLAGGYPHTGRENGTPLSRQKELIVKNYLIWKFASWEKFLRPAPVTQSAVRNRIPTRLGKGYGSYATQTPSNHYIIIV